MPEIPSCLFWEPPAGFLVNGPFSLPPFSLPRRSRGPVVNYGIEVCQELFHCPAISLIFTPAVTPQVGRGGPAAPPVPGRPGGSTGRRPLRPPGGGRRAGDFRSVAHLITVTAMEEGLSVHPIHGRPIGLKERGLWTFPHRARNYRLRMPANLPTEYLGPKA